MSGNAKMQGGIVSEKHLSISGSFVHFSDHASSKNAPKGWAMVGRTDEGFDYP